MQIMARLFFCFGGFRKKMYLCIAVKVGSNNSHCQIFEFVLALASDQRSSVEGKMLADKGCAPPRNGGEAKRRGCKDH